MASFRNTQSPQSVYDYWTPQRMQSASPMGMGVNMGAGRGGAHGSTNINQPYQPGRGGAGGSLYQGYASPTGAGGGGLQNQMYQTAAGPVTTLMGVDRTGGGRTGATAQPYRVDPLGPNMSATPSMGAPGAGADTGQITGAPMMIGGSQPTAQQQQAAPWQQSNFGNMGYQDRLNAVNQYRQGQNQGTLQQQVQQMRNQYQPMGGFGFGGGQYGQMGGGGLLGGGQWGGMGNQLGAAQLGQYNQVPQAQWGQQGTGLSGQWGNANSSPLGQWGQQGTGLQPGQWSSTANLLPAFR